MHHVEERSVRCFVATVSDTRTIETDKSGRLIIDLLEKANHTCIEHTIVKDEMDEIKAMLTRAVENDKVDVILLTGGTGIAKRDVTIEVVEEMFEKTIPGFGELFRMLSYTEDIGSRALLSRATAGVVNEKVVVAMPGSSGAVKLAMNKLIIPELSHFVHELHK